MTIQQYRQRWIRRHGRYEKQAYKILMPVFRSLANKIPFNLLSLSNYNDMINGAITQEPLINAYIEIYDTIGKREGEYVGKNINRQIRQIEKEWTLSSFLNRWERNLFEWLMRNRMVNIVSVRNEYVRYLQGIISFGIEDGKTLQEISKELQEYINNPRKTMNGQRFYRYQALRIARTETTTAANYAATRSASVSGVATEKVWIAAQDARTRRPPQSNFNHYAMDGVRVPSVDKFYVSGELLDYPGDPNASAGNIINCYLPNNFIESNIIEGQKSFYTGKALKIITRRGESITVTPNHGILTENGFVTANNIQIGNNLVCNRFIKNRILRLVNNYIKKKLFSVQNIFNSLHKFWLSKRLMVTALDFDTDGQSMNGNVNIVYPKIFLNNSIEAVIPQNIYDSSFMQTSFKSINISRLYTFDFFSSRNNSSFARLMSLLYLSFPLLFRHFRPLNFFTFGLASKLNVIRFKNSINNTSRDTEFLRELINTNSRNISFDDVIDIIEFDYSGHVYDFSSINGVNIVNNIYTSNCRCSSAIVPKRDRNGDLIYTV